MHTQWKKNNKNYCIMQKHLTILFITLYYLSSRSITKKLINPYKKFINTAEKIFELEKCNNFPALRGS